MAYTTYNSDGSKSSTYSKKSPTSTTVTYKKADGSLGTYQESSKAPTRSERQRGGGGLPADSMNTALDIKGGDVKDTSLAPVGTALAPEVEKPITAQQSLIQGTIQGAVPQSGALGGLSNLKPSTLPGASDLSSQYNSAATMLNQSGVSVAQGTGGGMAAVTQAMSTVGQPPEPPSILGGVMETDNAFDNIFKMYDDFMSPVKQKTSLVQEYQKMSKALGINELNAELVDAKKIIEGTEDDIRAEVTAAGGFATDSQVLALAGARNKSLIKNYNALLETRDNAMQQLNTMMNLTMEDRKSAEAELDRKMNFGFQVAQFQQRAQENARTTYLTLGKEMGWDSLLDSASPYERQLLQRTLGVSNGTLNKLAWQSQQDRLAKDGFTLGEGQSRYEYNPESGKFEEIASVPNSDSDGIVDTNTQDLIGDQYAREYASSGSLSSIPKEYKDYAVAHAREFVPEGALVDKSTGLPGSASDTVKNRVETQKRFADLAKVMIENFYDNAGEPYTKFFNKDRLTGAKFSESPKVAAFNLAQKQFEQLLRSDITGAAFSPAEIVEYQSYLPKQLTGKADLPGGVNQETRVKTLRDFANEKLSSTLKTNNLEFSGKFDSFKESEYNGLYEQASPEQKKLLDGNVSVEIPRASRLSFVNNNPGNLRFAGQAGAVKGEGGFAKFKNPQIGFFALINQIKLDASRGLSLSKFINKFAPPTENDTNLYIKQIASALKTHPNISISKLDIRKLAKAMALKESGTRIS